MIIRPLPPSRADSHSQLNKMFPLTCPTIIRSPIVLRLTLIKLRMLICFVI